ncbi:MAG TPA: hypothetical protein VGG27_00685 [Magnetospirillaceae bacterium]|jgi:hypothetical protein
MSLFNRNNKLQVAQSFIQMMSDVAEQMAQQAAETFQPAQQLRPIPIKANSFNARAPQRFNRLANRFS